jgi:hypothetical protein
MLRNKNGVYLKDDVEANSENKNIKDFYKDKREFKYMCGAQATIIYTTVYSSGGPGGIDIPTVVVLLVWLCCCDISAEVGVTVLTASCVRF